MQFKLIVLYLSLQSYFSRGGAKFIGMIVSPYNRNNPLPYSQITCLVISDEISPDGSYRKFSTKTTSPYFYLYFLEFYKTNNLQLCETSRQKSQCPQQGNHCLHATQYNHPFAFHDIHLDSSLHCLTVVTAQNDYKLGRGMVKQCVFQVLEALQ